MYIKNVVKRVFLKPLPQADAYGNTHRVSLEMQDGQWYSLGSTKQSIFGQLKTKQGFITENATLEFMFEQNGTFNNITKGSLKILAPGIPPKPEQVASQAPTNFQQPQQYQQPVQGQPMQQTQQYQQPVQDTQQTVVRREGVQIGAAMNQAIALVGPGNLNFDLIGQTAERLYQIAEKVKEGKVVLANESTQTQPANPVQNHMPQNQQESAQLGQSPYDAMDSDIPL
mgnify:CR=1 FL=1